MAASSRTVGVSRLGVQEARAWRLPRDRTPSRDSPLLLGLGLVLCVGGALALILDRRPSSIPAARPTSYVFAQEGWLQPTPLPSITNSDVTLHWTPYPAARWYDVTVLTEDLSVVHRAFMRQTTELTVPRTALPRSKLLWQVTVQPEQGERVDSSAFVLDLAEAER